MLRTANLPRPRQPGTARLAAHAARAASVAAWRALRDTHVTVLCPLRGRGALLPACGGAQPRPSVPLHACESLRATEDGFGPAGRLWKACAERRRLGLGRIAQGEGGRCNASASKLRCGPNSLGKAPTWHFAFGMAQIKIGVTWHFAFRFGPAATLPCMNLLVMMLTRCTIITRREGRSAATTDLQTWGAGWGGVGLSGIKAVWAPRGEGWESEGGGEESGEGGECEEGEGEGW
jgi:hypothetical protein